MVGEFASARVGTDVGGVRNGIAVVSKQPEAYRSGGMAADRCYGKPIRYYRTHQRRNFAVMEMSGGRRPAAWRWAAVGAMLGAMVAWY